MELGLVVVPPGEQPNPLLPVFVEILLQLVLLAIFVAVVVLVVRLVLRRWRGRRTPSTVGDAGDAAGLSHAHAYEAAYRFVADAARSADGPRSLAGLAESMQPVRDRYEEDSPTWLAWQDAVQQTLQARTLPRP